MLLHARLGSNNRLVGSYRGACATCKNNGLESIVIISAMEPTYSIHESLAWVLARLHDGLARGSILTAWSIENGSSHRNHAEKQCGDDCLVAQKNSVC